MTELAKQTNPRQTWIDSLRGFGIILMLIGHSMVGENIKHFIYGFHMPLFFVISGYLFDIKHEEDIRHFIKRKWKAYMVPYFVMCTCNLLLTIPLEFIAGTRGTNLIESIGKHIFWILYSFGEADMMPMCSPLWFLPCLFLASLYLYYYSKLGAIFKVVIAVAIFMFDWLLQDMDITQLPWHFDIAMVAMLIMYCGYAIRQFNLLQYIKVYSIAICFIIGIVSIYLNTKVDLVHRQYGNLLLFAVGSMAVCIALTALFKSFINKELCLAWIGRNSMWFMGANLMVNFILNEMFEYLSTAVDRSFYVWWINVILNFALISVWICIWKKMHALGKRRHTILHQRSENTLE